MLTPTFLFENVEIFTRSQSNHDVAPVKFSATWVVRNRLFIETEVGASSATILLFSVGVDELFGG